jgi:hypothetical protein
MEHYMEHYTGNHYVFRLDKFLVSGYFCGMGEVNGNFGMIFIGVTSFGMDISAESCLLISPHRMKCTLYSDILSLRRECRKIFKENNLTNDDKCVYFPIHQIIEMTTHEKREKTKG